MDLEKKMELLNIVESYWDLFPFEIQQLILRYKESQELIEWRESHRSRKMCWDIMSHGLLRIRWFIGPIRCQPRVPKRCNCRPRCFFMNIFGYWTLTGEKKRVFLGYGFDVAISRYDDVRNAIDFQTTADHMLSVCSLKLL